MAGDGWTDRQGWRLLSLSVFAPVWRLVLFFSALTFCQLILGVAADPPPTTFSTAFSCYWLAVFFFLFFCGHNNLLWAFYTPPSTYSFITLSNALPSLSNGCAGQDMQLDMGAACLSPCPPSPFPSTYSLHYCLPPSHTFPTWHYLPCW